jgi:ketosteroid isomerase-like protein
MERYYDAKHCDFQGHSSGMGRPAKSDGRGKGFEAAARTTGRSDAVMAWLHRWEALINAGDIAAAEPLFAEDVVAFGSLTRRMEGRDDLVARQWSLMWPRIRDFAFDYDHARILSGTPGEFAIVATPWRSLGRKGESDWYERRGRATLVLKPTSDGFTCVHSHFSMEPGIPPIID